MAMQAPTRITIEVHPPEPGMGWEQPVVRVVPEPAAAGSTQASVAAAPREDVPVPAAYEPARASASTTRTAAPTTRTNRR